MCRILYVEDNFENYKLVEFVLTKHGMSVMNASDGLDALDKAEYYKPDLIIMDINLPNLMGYEAASLLMTREATKNIPIVALTAAYSEEYKKLSEMAGCVAYFNKPIDPLSFAKEIRAVIDDHSHKKMPDDLSMEISKSLEEKARKVASLTKEISKYENKISHILSNLTDIVIITDKEYNMKFYNEQAMKNDVFKKLYEPDVKFFEIFQLVKLTLSELNWKLKDNLRINNVEICIQNEKKRYFFLANFSQYEDDILISLRDISEQVEYEGKIRLVEKFATIGEITSGIIHELNNPLTVIKTYLEILKMKLSASDFSGKISLIDIICKIDTGYVRIDNLIKSMMSFARPSSEKMYPLNINNLISEIMSFGEYEIRRGNVKVNMKLVENIPYIKGTKSEIEQALLNILINANHAVQTKEHPEINISTKELNDFIVVEIADNGYGIPKDIIDKVFEPFFTTKPEGKGTGLGLAIVKQILDRHSAMVEVFSDANGTKFVIRIPKIVGDA